MSINACAVTISNTPGTSGAFTVAAAVVGPYRAPASGDNAKAVILFVREGSAWEICASVYTHSGTSFSRGTLRDSSTGSRINFTAAAVVNVIGMDAAALADLTARLAADPLVTVASSGASFTQAVTAPGVIDITLTANCTLAFTGVPAGAWRVRLILRQDATGARTVSWPANTTWSTGASPTLAGGSNAINLIELTTVDAGTNWLGVQMIPSAAGAAPITTLLSDTFTRADNAASAGVATTGQTWVALTGTWGIASNQLYRVGTGTTDSILSANVGASWATYQASVLVTTEFPGLAFDITDDQNLYAVLVAQSTGRLELYRRVSGTYTKIAESVAGLFSSGTIVVQISRNATTRVITVSLAGAVVITQADSTLSVTNSIGMRFQTNAGSNTARWDSVTVQG